jgi:hypothetical protein
VEVPLGTVVGEVEVIVVGRTGGIRVADVEVVIVEDTRVDVDDEEMEVDVDVVDVDVVVGCADVVTVEDTTIVVDCWVTVNVDTKAPDIEKVRENLVDKILEGYPLHPPVTHSYPGMQHPPPRLLGQLV